MLNPERYSKACEWFHLLVQLDEGEQQGQVDQLQQEDASLAELVSELLRADLAVVEESFLENKVAPTRSIANNNFGSLQSGTDLPKTIGAFEIIDEIGKGGMGIVYRAHDAKPTDSSHSR